MTEFSKKAFMRNEQFYVSRTAFEPRVKIFRCKCMCIVCATDRSKAVVLMLFMFVWLCSALLLSMFTSLSSLIHCFHVCDIT